MPRARRPWPALGAPGHQARVRWVGDGRETIGATLALTEFFVNFNLTAEFRSDQQHAYEEHLRRSPHPVCQSVLTIASELLTTCREIAIRNGTAICAIFEIYIKFDTNLTYVAVKSHSDSRSRSRVRSQVSRSLWERRLDGTGVRSLRFAISGPQRSYRPTTRDSLARARTSEGTGSTSESRSDRPSASAYEDFQPGIPS